jgi:hypothetical protein
MNLLGGTVVVVVDAAEIKKKNINGIVLMMLNTFTFHLLLLNIGVKRFRNLKENCEA